ncbi:MAG TPA: hypothetical protein GXZ82_08190 [Firmicutes bacterium]|nr:hypothetical protein [Bacillota bacterium]
MLCTYGLFATAFPDTPYIQALLAQKSRQKDIVSTWDVDAAVRETAAYFSNLMRTEFQGGNRRYRISEDEYALLERGMPSTGFIPLNEMTAGQTYKGQEGGLYGNGGNEPPLEHRLAAEAAAAKIQPLDANGKPDPNGRIVLMSMGMSNTRQHWAAFKQRADNDRDKSKAVVVVNGAAGGQDARVWADPLGDHGRQLSIPPTGWKGNAWDYADAMLAEQGVTREQVQAVWIYQALMNPHQYGAYPEHAHVLAECIGVMVREAKRRYPNLQVVFLSSRTYAGYAVRELNPEPYAYESAFAVRQLILEQIDGNPRYNYDPAKGPVTAPVLVWGPYLWADGIIPRSTDGFTWEREDFTPPPDGTHPSGKGTAKVAQMLLAFFKTDPLTRDWFLK